MKNTNCIVLIHADHKKHKYLYKKKIGDKWRYFYDYKLTGKGYERDAERLREAARRNRQYAYSKAYNSPGNGYGKYLYDKLRKVDQLYEEAYENRKKADDAIIPKTIETIDDTFWNTVWTIEELPHNIVNTGRMAVATVLAGKASDYLINDILSKTDTQQVESGDWVYRSTKNGLTRMSKKEARDRKKYGDYFYDEYIAPYE